jgi:hypothetical protein
MLRVLMCLPLVSLAQDKPAPPAVVDVELAVRGPDGRVAANVGVTIEIRGLPSAAEIATKADSEGVARFKAPSGAYRMFVKVHGIGHGEIGTTEFVPGRVAHPLLSPLAAYGSIDGTFPAEACKGEVSVDATGGYSYGTLTVAPDSPGHFHISDAPGGYWMVTVRGDKKPCAQTDASFAVNPGQDLREVKIPSIPSAPPAGAGSPTFFTPIPLREIPKPEGPAVWARGTVRDDTGRPIGGASVMALGTFQGSIRMYQVTSQAVADAEGHYELKGEGGLPSFSATLVAIAPGHPPAWAWPAFPQYSVFPQYSASDSSEPPTQDFVLPSKSGKLNVTVVRDGKPVEGISVALYLENANLRDVWAMSMGDPKAIQDAAYPVAKTGVDGVAAFEDLLPGRYRILASSRADTIRNSLYGLPELGGLMAQSTGIPVRVGETTNYNLNFYEQQNKAAFRTLQSDGSPLITSAGISYGSVDTIWWNSSIPFDSSGTGKVDMDHAGLWQMQVVYRDTPIASSPIRGPYFLAAGYLATSPNLDGTNLPVFTARWIEPPSARIQVQDTDGNPLHVTVHVSNGAWSESFSATTDERGEVLFTGLTAHEKYFVSLSSAPGTEVKNIDLGKFLVRPAGKAFVQDAELPAGIDAPMPSPEKLHAEPAIMEKMFIAEANTETKVLMRQVPLHYIYGALRSPSDGPGQWECCWLEYPLQRRGAQSRDRLSTGEYLAGPFFPGDVRVTFGRRAGPHYHALVRVPANDSGPIHFDIEVEKYLPDVEPSSDPMATSPENVVMGMGGISAKAGGAHHLAGKVYYADGITPALGAQVLYFQRNRTVASLFAMADALGDLQPRGLWYSGSGGEAEKESGPDAPIVVAFLPGACGATMQKGPFRPGQPLRLVLPQPVSVAGQVTVGGVSPLHRPGVIHVIASYQGNGALNPYLSVATTADANGRFTLAGLTPGDYLIQAALDDIWLSPPAELRVSKSHLKSLRLAIPLPGAPVQVHVRDASGQAVVGTSITLDHAGPLKALWPSEWITDGAGSVYLPTLEAGEHSINVAGASQPLRFRVPPLPSSLVVLRVVVERPASSSNVKVIDDSSPYQP